MSTSQRERSCSCAADRVRTLRFDLAQITSRLNGNRPRWDDPSHPVCAFSADQMVVIIGES